MWRLAPLADVIGFTIIIALSMFGIGALLVYQAALESQEKTTCAACPVIGWRARVPVIARSAISLPWASECVSCDYSRDSLAGTS